jgi:redox-sensitive bicupin YhaK (pirin superfamily)
MWMSFDEGNSANPFHRGFRALGSLNEIRLLPGTKMLLPSKECHESITYVREGGLMVRHQPRREELLGPGFCQRGSTPRLKVRGASGKSPFQGAHIFVSSITPHREIEVSSLEHRHYPFSDRRGTLRLIASPDPDGASLRLQQDVRIYSSILDRGHHVVHELSPGRGVWLHVVAGKILLIDQNLRTGDGASLDDESAVSFTAQEPSEILLFDLA